MFKLFRPTGSSKGYFVIDGSSIEKIESLDKTNGIVVKYKNGLEYIYNKYDKIIDKNGNIIEDFNNYIKKVTKLDNVNEIENVDEINVGDIIFYNDNFVVVDNNILNEIKQGNISNTKVDIFDDNSSFHFFSFDNKKIIDYVSNKQIGVFKTFDEKITECKLADGVFGKALEIDNSGYIHFDKYILPEDFTFSYWYKGLPLLENSKGNTDNSVDAISFGIDGEKNFFSFFNRVKFLNLELFYIYIFDHDVYYLSVNNNNILSDEKWHHIVFTKNGTDFKIYIDGNEMELNIKTEKVKNYSRFHDFPAFSVIGGWSKYDNYYFGSHYLIDQIRIFNRPLTADEVQILYNEKTIPFKKIVF